MQTQAIQTELLEVGQNLGPYQLLRRLAIGGMAEIHLARKTGLEGFEKLVVLKRILPQYAANEEFVAMFLDEARLAATLHHPNIAQVYDIGRDAGSYYFTMELVHGEDVRQLMAAHVQRGLDLPLQHAIAIATGAAAGLHAAHERVGFDGEPLGIVHRDVSPSNILVSFDGCVKVVDFGVAKAESQRSETQAGTLKGKVSYMPPEAINGHALDRRGDVFALGVVLYEMTTGRRMFAGENEIAVARKIVAGEFRPPSAVRSDYPPALEAVVHRALAADRERRYQSAQELQLALDDVAECLALRTSPVALSSYLREMFSDKVARWSSIGRAAVARPQLATGSQCAGAIETWMFRDLAAGAHEPDDGRVEAEGSEVQIEVRAARPSRGLAGRLILAGGLIAAIGLSVVAMTWCGEAAHQAAEPRERSAGVSALEPPSRLLSPALSPSVPDGSDGTTGGGDADPAEAAAPGADEPRSHERRTHRRRGRRAPRSAPASESPSSWDPDSPLPPR